MCGSVYLLLVLLLLLLLLLSLMLLLSSTVVVVVVVVVVCVGVIYQPSPEDNCNICPYVCDVQCSAACRNSMLAPLRQRGSSHKQNLHTHVELTGNIGYLTFQGQDLPSSEHVCGRFLGAPIVHRDGLESARATHQSDQLLQQVPPLQQTQFHDNVSLVCPMLVRTALMQ